MSAFLLAKATGRNVLIALGLVVLWIGAFNFFFTPHYQAVSSGFVPFDMQFPLSREMIIIQLGAMTDAAPAAYVLFAAADMPFPLIASALTILFWAWLVTKSGSPALLGAFQRGWWIWGLFPAICDLGENVFFLGIILKHPEPMLSWIEKAIYVHRGKAAFLAMNQAATIALMIVTAVMWVRGKRSG